MITFNSSAIQSISDVSNENEVTIVFNNGKPYTYEVADVNAWNNDLNEVLSEDESVGRFVNRAIKVGILKQIPVSV